MKNIVDIIGYICIHYPHNKDIFKSRLTNIIYLADWKFVLKFKRQMTQIDLVFNHYGPYSDDIENIIMNDERFIIIQNIDNYGTKREIIKLKESATFCEIKYDEKLILDFVMQVTCTMNWDQFINFVCSTYPIASGTKYKKIDLVHCANIYSTILKK